MSFLGFFGKKTERDVSHEQACAEIENVKKKLDCLLKKVNSERESQTLKKEMVK